MRSEIYIFEVLTIFAMICNENNKRLCINIPVEVLKLERIGAMLLKIDMLVTILNFIVIQSAKFQLENVFRCKYH